MLRIYLYLLSLAITDSLNLHKVLRSRADLSVWARRSPFLVLLIELIEVDLVWSLLFLSPNPGQTSLE